MSEYVKSPGGILLPDNDLKVGGFFHGQIVRQGEVIDEFDCENLVVNQGLNSLLDVMFHGVTQLGPWFIGLFEANYTPVATVTAATISAAATESTAYDETTRQEFLEAAAASQSITNSANRATFTFNASKTIYGAFLVSESAKSATTGTLFSAAKFGSSKAVVDDDQLILTYTIGASST